MLVVLLLRLIWQWNLALGCNILSFNKMHFFFYVYAYHSNIQKQNLSNRKYEN